MKSKDLRNLSDEELTQKLKEFKTELFNLRFQLVVGQVDNPTRIKRVKKSIAQVQTIIRERQLEATGS